MCCACESWFGLDWAPGTDVIRQLLAEAGQPASFTLACQPSLQHSQPPPPPPPHSYYQPPLFIHYLADTPVLFYASRLYYCTLSRQVCTAPMAQGGRPKPPLDVLQSMINAIVSVFSPNPHLRNTPEMDGTNPPKVDRDRQSTSSFEQGRWQDPHDCKYKVADNHP